MFYALILAVVDYTGVPISNILQSVHLRAMHIKFFVYHTLIFKQWAKTVFDVRGQSTGYFGGLHGTGA